MTDISTLQQSLINAKRVMSKVDGGDFTKGSVNLPQGQVTDSTGLLNESSPLPTIPEIDSGSARRDLTPKSSMTEQQIKKSKLPEAIKQAMINHPIPDVPFNNSVGLSDTFVDGVKEQMQKQGVPVSTNNVQSRPNVPSPTMPTNTKKISSKNLKSIIKESVKELVDEVVSEKMGEITYLNSDDSDNFKFIVGNKIFYGKITASKDLK